MSRDFLCPRRSDKSFSERSLLAGYCCLKLFLEELKIRKASDAKMWQESVNNSPCMLFLRYYCHNAIIHRFVQYASALLSFLKSNSPRSRGEELHTNNSNLYISAQTCIADTRFFITTSKFLRGSLFNGLSQFLATSASNWSEVCSYFYERFELKKNQSRNKAALENGNASHHTKTECVILIQSYIPE